MYNLSCLVFLHSHTKTLELPLFSPSANLLLFICNFVWKRFVGPGFLEFFLYFFPNSHNSSLPSASLVSKSKSAALPFYHSDSDSDGIIVIIIFFVSVIVSVIVVVIAIVIVIVLVPAYVQLNSNILLIFLWISFNYQILLIFDYSHFCPNRGVPQTPTLRIPLKLQPKPRVLGFFDI